MKYFATLLWIMLGIPTAYSQNLNGDHLSHTYSIVAMDSVTGDLGVAVQSHWFSVGFRVTWAEAGVGAVATQSFTNPAFGPEGLALMKAGKSAGEALAVLLAGDEGRDYRQVALVDASGNSAVHTGEKCIAEAGHFRARYFSVQANLMLKNTVWEAMAATFRTTTGPLAERLLAALEAAQAQGGDIRGKQSAALLVVRGVSTGKVWENRLVDLRVEDHENPVQELKRLLIIHRAYQHMDAGDVAIEKGDEETALQEYATAEALQPGNVEMKYWHAVSLVNIGKMEQALPMFKDIFHRDENWRILTPRLLKPELLKVNEAGLKRIMEQ